MSNLDRFNLGKWDLMALYLLYMNPKDGGD